MIRSNVSEGMQNGMRVILTGAGGFLGCALLRKLAAHEQIGVAALSSQCEKLKAEFGRYPGIELYKSDAVIRGEVCVSERDILISCAFPRLADGEHLANGLDYIKNTLKASTAQGVGAVINISSQSVYHQQRKYPAGEQTQVCLDSTYAAGKYAAEIFAELLCQDRPFCNIRMASLIGPGFDQRVTNRMVDQALRTGMLTVRNGYQQFGLLDVEDAADGILKILSITPDKWKTVYNLGGKAAYSLMDIAVAVSEAVEKRLHKKIQIEVVKDDTSLNTSLDCTLLEKDTGFRQMISLEESIRRILEAKLQ